MSNHNSAACFHAPDFEQTVAECEAAIEKYMRDCGRDTKTRREISDATGIEYGTVAARVVGLMKKRRLYETGENVLNRATGKRAAKLIHVEHMPGMQGILFTGRT